MRGLVLGALCAACSSVWTAADDESAAAPGDDRAAQLLETMSARTEDVQIKTVGDNPRSATLLDKPCLRYSDVERGIADATLWVWTDGGRPVALQKTKCAPLGNEPVWTVCFSSLAADHLQVRRPKTGHGFTTTSPGCEFASLADGPTPDNDEKQIRAQIRQLSKRIGMTLNFGLKGQAVSRLLPRPAMEYAAPEQGVVQGAIFGFASYGTNPDGYVLIELRKTAAGQEWVYGCVRMTHYGMVATLDEQPVLTLEQLPVRPTYFENWTFFFEHRTEFVTP